MSPFRSDLLNVLSERGFIHQLTDAAGLDAAASSGRLTVYTGFDATADSLHVGSLVQIMMLRWVQKTGHRPIALMGGGTTKVGDPSGKDESRQLLSDEAIRRNIAGIRRNFEPFLAFGEGPSDAVMADNAEWLDQLEYISFIRDIGRHFTVNRMLTFDSVRLRLEREQPLTFLEFNYMILQAYDFVELARRYDCTLQLGGSDQWGNIVNGIDLARRLDDRTLYGLTTPLITTASGAKMGKTAAGALWLAADRLSPYEYWQFWRNADDADVGRFLRLFTELPPDETRRLESLGGAEINEAKKILANEATKLLHGADAAAKAADTAHKTFEQGEVGAELPRHVIDAALLGGEGLPLFSALAQAGLATSGSEGRRLIKGGGARVNDEVVQDEMRKLTLDDLKNGSIKLSAGRKRHALMVLEDKG